MTFGKICLVGIGPGDAEQMTARAREAIMQSDVVIGYRTYIRLIEDLLQGKAVIEKGMAEELDRCTEALDLARQGHRVALVSSGDVGVFGMAGPLYEVLFEQGWTPGEGVAVEVVPGVTAASACASLVGAPLTHDFCAISLSDLLTPWPVIARRLEAAARADFVTVLYNPRSSRRPRQILEARDRFLRHRDPATPVAVVQAAYRPREAVVLTTLADMADGDVTMLTSLIIGNSSSFVREGLMVTPRGYTAKYDLADGATRPGEVPRVSLSSGLDGWLRQLREQAAKAGIDAAALALSASHSQVLDALVETGADDLNVTLAPDSRELLRRALAWEDARLRLSATGQGGATIDLADQRVREEGDRLVIDGTGWRVELPWPAVRRAYLVRGAAGDSAWFQGDDGGNLWRIECRHAAGPPSRLSRT